MFGTACRRRLLAAVGQPCGFSDPKWFQSISRRVYEVMTKTSKLSARHMRLTVIRLVYLSIPEIPVPSLVATKDLCRAFTPKLAFGVHQTFCGISFPSFMPIFDHPPLRWWKLLLAPLFFQIRLVLLPAYNGSRGSQILNQAPLMLWWYVADQPHPGEAHSNTSIKMVNWLYYHRISMFNNAVML